MDTMMIEIPRELKGVVEPLRALIADASEQIARGRSLQRADYDRFERTVAERVAAVEQGVHQGALAALDFDRPRISINGVEHARVGRCEAEYKTRAGSVRVERSLYRAVGDRTGRVVNTVSLRAEAIEDEWLPGVARQMAHLLQQGTTREAEVTTARLGLLPYSRSSFERIGHAVGRRYVERHAEIEEALIQSAEVPAAACSVSASLDRVSVPMEEPRSRPVGRPRKGAPKRPVSRVYRMAYCGTVTLHDAEGNGLYTLRYGTMPEGDAAALAMQMANDVLVLRRERPDLKVTLLCDGAPELWRLLDEAFQGPGFGDITRLLDFWHLIEKLAPAAEALYGGEGSGAVLQKWKLSLLNRVGGAAGILEELHWWKQEQSPKSLPQAVHEAITYLENNGERMIYARARRQGLPIGSGNVEATCKNLVTLRMKRSGSRWKTQTGEEVIRLRALSLSDRWEEAMDRTLRKPPVRIQAAA